MLSVKCFKKGIDMILDPTYTLIMREKHVRKGEGEKLVRRDRSLMVVFKVINTAGGSR